MRFRTASLGFGTANLWSQTANLGSQTANYHSRTATEEYRTATEGLFTPQAGLLVLLFYQKTVSFRSFWFHNLEFQYLRCISQNLRCTNNKPSCINQEIPSNAEDFFIKFFKLMNQSRFYNFPSLISSTISGFKSVLISPKLE